MNSNLFPGLVLGPIGTLYWMPGSPRTGVTIVSSRCQGGCWRDPRKAPARVGLLERYGRSVPVSFALMLPGYIA